MDCKLHRCYKCKVENFTEDLMAKSNGKIRNVCKKCRCLEEKERRSRKSKETLKELNKQYYKNHKKRMVNIDESTDEGLSIAIHHWVYKNCNRNSENKFKQRKGLDKEFLKELCYRAKDIFPEITFNNRRDKGNSLYWASIDRIDPDLPYKDDNIVVVPLWLNSAKLDSTYKDLFNAISKMDKDKFFELLDKL